MKIALRFKLIVVTLLMLIGVFIVAMLHAAREASCRIACRNNLVQIALALQAYHAEYHAFPLAVERSMDGELWRSWRTQLYPRYMQQIGMFYDTKSSWDSPRNMRLLNGTPVQLAKKDGTPYSITIERVPWPFSCPTSKKHARGGTSYVVVIGDETAFPINRSVALSEILDGLENTIVVVESITCRPDWTEPHDLNFATMSFEINNIQKPSISSDHTGGALVCFADGEVGVLKTDATQDEVRAMLTIAGGENVLRRDLINRGVLSMFGSQFK